MIDTHTHLFSSKFDADREAAVTRALDAGVKQMYLPNIDAGTVDAMLVLAEAYPSECLPMLGLHPTSVKANYREELNELEARLGEREWVAIGEIGTDLYWSDEFWEEQQAAFVTQCEWAIDLGRPVSVHCRESIDETIAMLRPLCARGLRGVLHCFTGTVAQAKQATALGLYLGIGGVATYKNSGELAAVLGAVSRESLLLETDSPYLAPVPKRGKRNESAFLPYVAQKVAEVLEASVAEVEAFTTANAERLFGRALAG